VIFSEHSKPYTFKWHGDIIPIAKYAIRHVLMFNVKLDGSKNSSIFIELILKKVKVQFTLEPTTKAQRGVDV